MNAHRFLFDENVPIGILLFLKQTEPTVEAFIIGDDFAPSKGTLDPNILTWIEENNCFLVTNNRASMPVHLKEHLQQGKHIPGIIQLPRQINVQLIVDDLILLWQAAESNEFQDQIIHLPL